MNEEKQILWRLTWDLEIFPFHADELSLYDAPDANCFRVACATEGEAILWKAEIQRYMGGRLISIINAVLTK